MNYMRVPLMWIHICESARGVMHYWNQNPRLFNAHILGRIWWYLVTFSPVSTLSVLHAFSIISRFCHSSHLGQFSRCSCFLFSLRFDIFRFHFYSSDNFYIFYLFLGAWGRNCDWLTNLVENILQHYPNSNTIGIFSTLHIIIFTIKTPV